MRRSATQSVLRAAVVGVVLLAAAVAAAQDASEKAAPPVDQAAVLKFVRQNHKALAPLLQGLRDMEPAAFREAVAELDQVRRRLETIRARDPESYRLNLRAWKLDSQIAVLVARNAGNENDPAFRAELGRLLEQRMANRLAVKDHEIVRARQRLDRLTRQREQMAARQDDDLQRRFRRLVKYRPAPKRAVPVGTADAKAAGDAARDR